MKVFLNEGVAIEVKGSGKKPYLIKKTGGIVDCNCPAWRNIGGSIDVRVCKHIRSNIERSCLLPQAHPAYDNSVDKTTNNNSSQKSLEARKPAVKKLTAPPVLLAHSWADENPAEYWISEKMDGVRMWWTGEKLLSRLGNEFHAPIWFKAVLPKVVLDGELFIDRKKFQETISTVRKYAPADEEWSKITYVVYDAPKYKGTFEERISYIKSFLPLWEPNSIAKIGHVAVLEQTRCESLRHMQTFLKEIEKKDGEGIMLRKAGSFYEEGRSNTLLKVKTFLDAEGIVVKHEPGKGRHKGRLGALWIRWNGLEFKIGTGFTDKERNNPPKVGSTVTFHYTDVTKAGVPKCAGFLAVRDYE